MDKTAGGAKGLPPPLNQKGKHKPSSSNLPSTPEETQEGEEAQEEDTSAAEPGEKQTVRRPVGGSPRKGRIKSDSELYDRVRLKAALQVLRSGLSPEEKLSALKRGRDHWSQGSQDIGYASWLHDMVESDSSGWLHLVGPKAKSMQATPSQCPDGIMPSPSSGTSDETFEFFGNVFRERFPAAVPTTPVSQRLSSGDMDLVLTPPQPSTAGVQHPVVVIEEVDTEDGVEQARNAAVGTSALPAPKEDHRPPKSPVTVQEWVDAIDLNHPRLEDECGVPCPEVPPMEDDTLHLGAEAQHPEGETCDGRLATTNPQQLGNCPTDSEQLRNLQAGHPASLMKVLMEQRRTNFVQNHEQQSSFQSDASSLSASSLSSVETLLESRREDPEQILLNLGFGGNAEPHDPLARIPHRFLQPSKVRGNSLEEFIRHQEELLETLDSGFCGYRGLSGFLREHKQPVGIVGKILQKIKDTDRDVRHRSSSPSSTLTSFSEVAFSILAVNTFRHALARSQQQKQQHSILAPANRELLAQQEEERAIDCDSPKRVIVGQDEFKIDLDGSLILSGKVENDALPKRRTMSLVEDDDDETFLPDVRVETTNESFGKSLWSKCRLATGFHSEEQALNTEQPRSERRLSQLTRQNSICEERNDSLQDVGSKTNTRPSKLEKLVPSKESFELEELPSNHEGDEEHEVTREHSGPLDPHDPSRIGSALSDSSGFLEGETSDLVVDDASQKKEPLVADESAVPIKDLSTTLSVPLAIPHLQIQRVCPIKVLPLSEVSNGNTRTSQSELHSHVGFDRQQKKDCEFVPIDKPTDPTPHPPVTDCNLLHDRNDVVHASRPRRNRLAGESEPDESDFSNDVKLVLQKEKRCSVPDMSVSSRLAFSKSAYKRLRVRHCSLDDGSSEGLNLVSYLDPMNNAVTEQDVCEASGASVEQPNSCDRLLVQADNGSDHFVVESSSPTGSPCASIDLKESPKNQHVLCDQDDIDQEYSDMLHLLTVISNGAVSLCISREEFVSKPLEERVQIQAQALMLALEKYQSTLSSEQLALERYHGVKTHAKSTLRLELQVLCELRAGICQEVAHMRTLLANRLCSAQKGDVEDLRRGTASSIHLIRQMSLLLHQQNTLCKHLESLHLKATDSANAGPPFATFSSLIENRTMVPAEQREVTSQAPIQQRMQQLFNRLQEHVTTQVQEAVRQEHQALRHELQENRQELQEIKMLLQQLVTSRAPSMSSPPSSPNEKLHGDKL